MINGKAVGDHPWSASLWENGTSPVVIHSTACPPGFPLGLDAAEALVCDQRWPIHRSFRCQCVGGLQYDDGFYNMCLLCLSYTFL